MKTAVSIPDELFEDAERAARQAGVTRSRLYADALRRYLRTMPDAEITARVNAVYGRISNELDPVLDALQSESLGVEDWGEPED